MAYSDDIYTLFKQINGNALSGLKGTGSTAKARCDTIAAISKHGMDLTAPKPPSPPPPDPTATFADGFEDGTIKKWLRSGDVTQPDPTPDDSIASEGNWSLKFSIPDGSGSRDYQRQYVMPKAPDGNVFWWKEGDEGTFNFSYYLAPGFPNPSGSWYDLTQWWNTAGGSPPVELGISAGNNYFTIGGGWGHPNNQHPQSDRNAGPVVTGKWINWKIHIKFSSDPSKGVIDLWRDGTQLVSGFQPIGGTLYPGGNSYIETGIYRAKEAKAATLWQDNWSFTKK